MNFGTIKCFLRRSHDLKTMQMEHCIQITYCQTCGKTLPSEKVHDIDHVTNWRYIEGSTFRQEGTCPRCKERIERTYRG